MTPKDIAVIIADYGIEIRAAERERCAKIAENIYGGRAHTYASENADVYRAQDDTCAKIAAAIRNKD